MTRVLFEANRAVGVEVLCRGQRHEIRAEREVLLSGGVINSPQLLMLSGIGDPGMLEPLGIRLQAALPRGARLHLQIPLPAADGRPEA